MWHPSLQIVGSVGGLPAVALLFGMFIFSAQPAAAYSYTKQTCDAFTDWHLANSDWRGSANSIGDFVRGCAIGEELGQSAATVANCEARCGGVYGRGDCCQCRVKI